MASQRGRALDFSDVITRGTWCSLLLQTKFAMKVELIAAIYPHTRPFGLCWRLGLEAHSFVLQPLYALKRRLGD